MLMVLPFRAKNPPEGFPYVTVTLIVLNTLVYACTSHYFLYVREDAVARFAFSHNTLSPWTLLTAMFLHESPLHLGGNMLFLWIFGAAVEGRLRPLRYLAVYLFAGIIGDLLSDFISGLIDPETPNLGASGAIMGLAGAYLCLFPYSPIRLGWFIWFGLLPRAGITEWQARWVILYFVGLDVFNGILMGGGDGVGHFAHLGGAAAGFLAVLLLRVPRDDEDMSIAQASLSDMGDLSLMTLQDLEALMQRPTDNVNLVLAYCRQAIIAPIGASEAKCLWGLRQYGNLLMEQAEPDRVAGLLLPLSLGTARQIPSVFYLRLGTRLERAHSNDAAVRLYHRMGEVYAPPNPDLETAYCRVGRLMEEAYRDPVQARFAYEEALRLYPQGRLSLDARRALARLSGGSPAPPRPPMPRPPASRLTNGAATRYNTPGPNDSETGRSETLGL